MFVIGLMASVPLVVAGAGLVMSLLTRFPVLVRAGAALLGWIAGQVIATDPAVKGLISQYCDPGSEIEKFVEYGAALAGALSMYFAAWRTRVNGNSEPA
jgi:predicted tellurium resistance membrane protein TerC